MSSSTSTAIELSFAESVLVSYNVVGAANTSSNNSTSPTLKRPSVSLLHGTAQCCGVPLPLYSPISLESGDPSATTVIDCTSENGCRLQLSSGGDRRTLNIRRVPFASTTLLRFLSRVREARTAAKSTSRPPPRCLVVGFGDGASGWCSRVLTLSLSQQQQQQQQQPAATGGPSSSVPPPPPPPPTIVVNASLAPHEVKMRDGEMVVRTVPAGCVSLQFTEGSSSVDPLCTELYTFFIGATCNAAQELEESLLDVLSIVNDIIVRVSSASIEFASACVVVNLGEFGRQSDKTHAAADGASSSVAAVHDRIGSLLPKILRLLRISHVAALVGTVSPSSGQLLKALQSAVTSVVYGVVLEEIEVTWPPRHHDDCNSLGLLAETARSEAMQRYLAVSGGGDQRSNVFRLVLDASPSSSRGVKLIDAKTLKPMSLSEVKPFAVCGVVAASASVAERVAAGAAKNAEHNDADSADSTSAAAAVRVHSALCRPVVGFVVVTDIGATSSLVVVAPAAGDLPSNTLLVANDLIVDGRFVPSVLATN